MDIASDYDLLDSSSDSSDPEYDQSRKDPNIITSMDKVAYRMRHDENGVIWHGIIDPKRPNSPPVEWPEYPDRLIQDDHPYGRDPVYNKILHGHDEDDDIFSSDDGKSSATLFDGKKGRSRRNTYKAGCGDQAYDDEKEEGPMSDGELKVPKKPVVSEALKMTEMMEADDLLEDLRNPPYPGLYPGDHGNHYGDEDLHHRQSLWKEDNWKLPNLQQYQDQDQNKDEIPELDLEW